MKKLIPFFVLGTIASANAQVEIVQADFATVGDTITFGDQSSGVDTLGIDLGSTGSGLTFNFSSLQTESLFEVGFYDPAGVDGGADFPTADVAVDQIGGIYGFTTINSGSVDIIGLGGDFGPQLGIPTSAILSLPATDPWTLFEFPASTSSPVLLDTAVFQGRFPTGDLLPEAVSFVWPDLDSVWVKRTIYYEADIVADGVLTDPLDNTHNVIKVNVIENSLDSILGRDSITGIWEDPPSALLESIAGIVIPSNDTVYRTRYISKELGYYVVDLTTDENGVPESATFVSDASQCCVGVEELVSRGQTVLYPNPTNDFVRVRTGGDIYEFNVYDMTGKLHVSELLTMDNQAVRLEGLANGLYIYQMIDQAGKVAHTSRLSVIK